MPQRSIVTEVWQECSSDPCSLLSLAKKYLLFLKVREYSKFTIAKHRYHLGFFLIWCREMDIYELDQVQQEILLKYQIHLSNLYSQRLKGILTPTSQKTYMSCVCRFFAWLEKQKYIVNNPAAKFKFSKPKRLPGDVLTVEEVERVLNQIDISTPLGIRNRAIIETFYSTGIRRGELIGIKVEDVHLQEGTLLITQGKGKKDRLLPIGERALLWINKYLLDVRPLYLKDNGQKFLFLGRRGKPLAHGSLSNIIRPYLNAAEIKKQGCCHLFRRSMATQMLENGAGIRSIQEILGHNRLDTTELYTKVCVENLAEVHQKNHPMEKKPYSCPSTQEFKPPILNKNPATKGPVCHFWDNPTAANDLIVLASKCLSKMTLTHSQKTVREYRFYLRYFIEWCHQREIYFPQDVNPAIIESYSTYLFHLQSKKDGKPLSVANRISRLCAIENLFRFLTEESTIKIDPTVGLEKPKQIKRLPRNIPTSDEIEKIISQPDVSTAMGIRNRAILELLYSTGIRRKELVGIQLNDLDLDRCSLVIRNGKGNKDRIVPIGHRAASWLAKYLHEVRPLLQPAEGEMTFFIAQEGRRFNVNALGWLVTRYIRAAGQKGSCHIFRHAMATHMLDNGTDIRHLQAILGHKCLSSTEIYTQVSIVKLKEVHTKTHPAKMYPTKSDEIKRELE